MGQAKRRGTFEERKAQAISKKIESVKNGDFAEHSYVGGKGDIDDFIREDKVHQAKKTLNGEQTKDMETWLKFAKSILKEDGMVAFIGN